MWISLRFLRFIFCYSITFEIMKLLFFNAVFSMTCAWLTQIPPTTLNLVSDKYICFDLWLSIDTKNSPLCGLLLLLCAVKWRWSKMKFFKSKKVKIEILRGPRALGKKFLKIYFFCKKYYFFCLNLYCICSQLSFEVHNSSIAQNLKYWPFCHEKFHFCLSSFDSS